MDSFVHQKSKQADAEQVFSVLGVRVNAVRLGEAIDHIERRIRERMYEHPAHCCGRYVAVTGMHGIGEAKKNPAFRYALDQADLIVPDGMPLIWLARWRGLPLRERVCGSDLLETFCRHTGPAYRHFFYGGAPGVAQTLARELCRRTGITVAGTYTPPFRKLNAREERDLARTIDRAAPDILWVGLGTPKQERWMLDHHAALRIPVMVGVGAAFDMVCGQARRAPLWMQRCGLEWFFRLCSEPRRLWKRYLITIPMAMWCLFLDELHFRRLQ
jgi:N-acetylglucosaminyldiphosphoundecaprenol N-acetyl-beta-D-mannosaminyltransferase